MESTLYILLWHGEIGHLVLLWNLLGHLMESMLFERVLQKLKFSLKTSRFVTLHYFQFIDHYSFRLETVPIHLVISSEVDTLDMLPLFSISKCLA